MRRTLLPILVMLISVHASAQERDIAGVRLPENTTLAEHKLTLSGGDLLRWRLLFRIYVAALYLPPGTAAERALDDLPRRIVFHYQRGFSAADLVAATDATITRGLDDTTVAGFRSSLESFNALYRAVQEGDVMAIDYQPAVGTSLHLNGTHLGTVPGASFARALFAIWIGDHAVDDSLKAALLGQGKKR